MRDIPKEISAIRVQTAHECGHRAGHVVNTLRREAEAVEALSAALRAAGGQCDARRLPSCAGRAHRVEGHCVKRFVEAAAGGAAHQNQTSSGGILRHCKHDRTVLLPALPRITSSC